MLAAFLTSVVISWIVSKGASVRFGAVISAGQVAAWQSKWVALPVAIAALWCSSRLTRNIKKTPERFAGLPAARAGFSAAIVTTLMVGTLIGITVPERLRRRQWSIEAANKARGYTLHRALQEYRDLHGTLPPEEELVKQLGTLADPDGSIAEALRFGDANGYQVRPGLLAAAAPKNKTLPRGAALRNASLNTADPPAVSFINYDWRLPGEDKLLNTDDDFIIHDGLVMTIPEYRDYVASRSSVP